MKKITPIAYKTTVSVVKSQQQIRELLRVAKATDIATLQSDKGCKIACVMSDRRLVFSVPPAKDEKEEMRLWRVLRLKLKLHLEEMLEPTARFDEVFMAYILLPDGRTIAEHVLPAIEQSYKTNKPPQIGWTE